MNKRTYENSSGSKNGFRIYNIFVRRTDGIVLPIDRLSSRRQVAEREVTDVNKYLCVRKVTGTLNETYFRRIREMHRLERKYATMFRWNGRFQYILTKQMFKLKLYNNFCYLFIFIFYDKCIYTHARYF